jgi:hypothetical protein
MANQLSKTKKRISYAEDIEVLAKLKKIAAAKKVTLTDVIREAASEYILNKKK